MNLPAGMRRRPRREGGAKAETPRSRYFTIFSHLLSGEGDVVKGRLKGCRTGNFVLTPWLSFISQIAEQRQLYTVVDRCVYI